MLQFRVQPHDDFFFAHLHGLVSMDAWDRVLQDLEHAISDAPGDRMVLDLTGLVGWLGLAERTAVGGLMAKRFARMKKVALFIQPEKITGAVEKQAQRNGLDLRVFSSDDEAMRWVLS